MWLYLEKSKDLQESWRLNEVIRVRPYPNKISVHGRRGKALYEDTAWRQSYKSQEEKSHEKSVEEKSHEKSVLLASWPWPFSLQNCEKNKFLLLKLSCLWNFVMAAWANTNNKITLQYFTYFFLLKFFFLRSYESQVSNYDEINQILCCY